MSTFSTYLNDFKIKFERNLALECYVENVNLALGLYYVDVLFISKMDEKINTLENVISFEVITSDFYNIKKKFKPKFHGNVVLRNDWVQIGNKY